MENKLEQSKNSGVLVKLPDPIAGDYIASAESGIIYSVRNENGDWEKYKPTDEWQRKKIGNNLGYDTMSCVTFSELNQLEMQVYFLIQNKILSEYQIQKLNEMGYLDENGRPNFNDWFSAVMSGTTINGNYINSPWDSFRKDGVLPQSMGCQVNDFNSTEEWLAAKPSATIKLYAKNILEIIDIAYEWVPANIEEMKKALKQSPLSILTPTSSNWNTKPPKIIKDPGMKSVNHATSCIGITDNYVKDLDHYNPFIKYLDLNYYMPYVVKGVVTVAKPKVDEWSNFTYIFNVNINYGESATSEVKALQMALQKLGYMKKGVYGPYGPQTRTAVKAFQVANGILDDDGSHFGPRTRKQMNLKMI